MDLSCVSGSRILEARVHDRAGFVSRTEEGRIAPLQAVCATGDRAMITGLKIAFL
jgi:hypothetical protein